MPSNVRIDRQLPDPVFDRQASGGRGVSTSECGSGAGRKVCPASSASLTSNVSSCFSFLLLRVCLLSLLLA
eukprot:461863-Hanusia_phi.AAC.4